MSHSQCVNCGKPVQDQFVFVQSDDELDDISHSTLSNASQITSSLLSSSTLSNVSVASVVPAQPLKQSHTLPPTHFHKNLLIRADARFQLEVCLAALNDPDAGSVPLPSCLCPDCNTILLQELDQLLAAAEREHRTYRHTLLHKTKQDKNEEILHQIEMLRAEEQSLELFHSKLMQQQTLPLQHALQTAKQDYDKALEARRHLAQQATDYIYSSELLFDMCDSLSSQNQHALDLIQNLEARNVYQDIFYIDTDHQIATINSHRLGRLANANANVPWSEINAAWGQAALLLYALANKLKFPFSRYRILPLGSRTTIQNIQDQATYNLFGSDELGFGSWFWGLVNTSSLLGGSNIGSSFDDGMVAFLYSLEEMMVFAESQSPAEEFSFKIKNDKIGGKSIKMSANNTEVTWTLALHHLLTNLNQLLAWVCTQDTTSTKQE